MQSGAHDDQGWIDYTFARRSVLADLASGRISRADVCDGHPELLRVARHQGEPVGGRCPVCDADSNVTVTFAFGDRLARRNGRMVRSDEIAAYVAIPGVTCYTVEVCTACSWNHLLRSHAVVPEESTGDVEAGPGLRAAEPSTDAE